ncbi:MAG: hypothetical protein ACI9R3_003818 [Verrucomicrobiales bacterium]|jgi:hypothetical protein
MSQEIPAVDSFRTGIEPILQEYCYDCHGDGASKGEIAFDALTTNEALLDHDLWLKVLKNVRTGLMPPNKKPQPSREERQQLEKWIKHTAFGLDPQDPDPGRVTIRRLNRIEYRNTIRDLMDVDFKAEVEFPPDDTGYGFDTIGDVLTVSPLLLEKYLDAAKTIVSEAVPTVAKVVQEKSVPGYHFHSADEEKPDNGERRRNYRRLDFYEPATVSTNVGVDRAGSYRLELELEVNGEFDFDPGKCRVVFKLEDRELLKEEFGYYDNKTFKFSFDEQWEPGERGMTLSLEPLTPIDQKKNSLEMRIHQVKVIGPLEKDGWVPPENYARYFTRPVPYDATERRAYAGQVLGTFATKAFRRPVDGGTIERLSALAESVYTQPGKTFEVGVGHAMVAVLASPRFLFRLEEPADILPDATSANVDEYALASRLSYFLWSTMPDAELLGLAERGELRKNLANQVKRMLTDSRSEQMIRNFTGQWLQVRDVEGISINSRAILARDSGREREIREERAAFRAFLAQRDKNIAAGKKPADFPKRRRGRDRGRRIELDGSLRYAMQRETEMFFASIVHEDRAVTELIDSDYTFLNEKLAELYGIEGVKGSDMQRISLPADSPRGGVLTQGSTLVVTSNPDRTSPVKRGLFILDNFLGTPAPPPPPNIPSLEASEEDFGDHDPTLREALQLHREKPLCASCHQRMDPIGLAFENFNAMSMWREKERNQTIDAAGTLITGETFNSVSELKRILANDHRVDFYHCLTEKLMTYALGRGPEYYDVESIDQIVARLEREDGRFSALLMGIIESTPFQKMRLTATQSSQTTEP